MERGSFARGGALLLGLAASNLGAQSLALPASDPVGIARGGAGVAFGRNLEAAGLNPALLVTLDDRRSAYLAGGMDLQSTQVTLQSNQNVLYTTDRNRFLPSFGAAWRLGDKVVLGLVGDTPFARHVRLPLQSEARFLGDQVDLRADRIQFQAGFKLSDRFSLGAGIGIARMTYTFGSTVRAQIPLDPSQPISAGNPSQGLVETGVMQSGSGISPAVSAGFRFAINPRWTVGGAVQGPLKASMDLSPSQDGRAPTVYANDGYSAPLQGTAAAADALLKRVSVTAGSGDLQLPWKASLGVRQRVNQIFTWEFDARWLGSKQLKAPTGAQLSTPSGPVASPVLPWELRDSFGFTLMGELSINKNWTLRGAMSVETGWTSEPTVTPVYGGPKTAGFSGGFGYKLLGGELIAGYQFRQAKDVDSPYLEGQWSRVSIRSTGTNTRVEAMGHLFSIGFRRAF